MVWARRSQKFGSKRTQIDGFWFGSKLEAVVYQILKNKELLGEISNLKCQVCVYLTDAKILYKPDFYYEENGKPVYAEAKGVQTPSWRIKRRLWKHYGPGKLEIYMGSYKYPKLYETIIPT